ncbi:hypothetical protein H4219_003016 [Mycoemilia scoparia]|uniref:Uncharacterized protein n=1 Tax=Mycoemilia scoparia TaxID=417184 RepID=A0A9W8DU02_9FUNG|nr:hypothetical protein H4219_003016 [Mycoemilia scoparia]
MSGHKRYYDGAQTRSRGGRPNRPYRERDRDIGFKQRDFGPQLDFSITNPVIIKANLFPIQTAFTVGSNNDGKPKLMIYQYHVNIDLAISQPAEEDSGHESPTKITIEAKPPPTLKLSSTLCNKIISYVQFKQRSAWPKDMLFVYDGESLLYSNHNICDEETEDGKKYVDILVNENDMDEYNGSIDDQGRVYRPKARSRNFQVHIVMTRLLGDIPTAISKLAGNTQQQGSQPGGSQKSTRQPVDAAPIKSSTRGDSPNLEDFQPIETLCQILDLSCRTVNKASTSLSGCSGNNSSDIVQIKNVIYDTTSPLCEREGLIFIPGFYAKPLVGKSALYMNIHTSIMPIYPSGNLLDVVRAALFKNNPVEKFGPWLIPKNPTHQQGIAATTEDLARLKKYLKGLKVSINRHQKSKTIKKIQGITNESAERSVFELRPKDGTDSPTTKISVANYFKQRYNIILQYPYLPCVKMARGDIFPMELLSVLPNQQYLDALSKTQRDFVISSSAQNPRDKEQSIMRGLGAFNFDRNQSLAILGIKVKQEMVKLNAKILPNPKLWTMGKNQVQINQGTWRLGGGGNYGQFYQGSVLSHWGIIVCNDSRALHTSAIDRFCGSLTVNAARLGMTVEHNRPGIIRYTGAVYPGDSLAFTDQLRQLFQQMCSQMGGKPRFLFIVLPQKNAPIYKDIKAFFELENGIITQCAAQKAVEMCQNAYISNILFKINMKLGGATTALSQESLPGFAENITMVIGLDISHQGPNQSRLDRSTPSFAALTASTNRSATRFRAFVNSQINRGDIVLGIDDLVVKALQSFYSANKKTPERLVIFNDGVSDTQFELITKAEIDAIRRACIRISEDYRPPITFIVCQKGHKVRFFPEASSGNEGLIADRTGNCLPGTLVDSGITSSGYPNFYLLSHPGLKGTSRPNHYFVLVDENNFKPEEIQKMTYNMCYNYGLCTRAVSVPPAIYYSHKAANHMRILCASHLKPPTNTSRPNVVPEDQLVSQFEVHKNIENEMFYI